MPNYLTVTFNNIEYRFDKLMDGYWAHEAGAGELYWDGSNHMLEMSELADGGPASCPRDTTGYDPNDPPIPPTGNYCGATVIAITKIETSVTRRSYDPMKLTLRVSGSEVELVRQLVTKGNPIARRNLQNAPGGTYSGNASGTKYHLELVISRGTPRWILYKAQGNRYDYLGSRGGIPQGEYRAEGTRMPVASVIDYSKAAPTPPGP